MGKPGFKHWKEALENPRRPIIKWHVLQDPEPEEDDDKDKDGKKGKKDKKDKGRRRRTKRRNRQQTRTKANNNKTISFLKVDGFVISVRFGLFFQCYLNV